MARYQEELAQVNARRQEALAQYQQEITQRNLDYQAQLEDYRRQQEEGRRRYEEELRDYQDQLAQYEQHIRETVRMEGGPIEGPAPQAPGWYAPLTEQEYHEIYSRAYKERYDPAYERLYSQGGQVDPLTVSRIAEEADAAAHQAVENARVEKLNAVQPKKGGWEGWVNYLGEALSGLGREIDQAMSGLGSEIDETIGEAMQELSEGLGEMRDELFEAWEEQLEEDEEEDEDEYDQDFPFGGRNAVDVPGVERQGDWYVYTANAGMNALERVEIQWSNGQVLLRPWDKDYVEVSERCKQPLRADQRMMWGVTDAEKIFIKDMPDQRKGLVSKLIGPLGGLSKNLTVSLPRRLAAEIENLKVNTVSAPVNIQELSGERFSVNTTSGAIFLQEVHGESVKLGAVSGAISLQGIHGETLKASSVSGALNMEGSSVETLDLGCTSGKLTALGFEAENAHLHTVSGSIEAQGNAESFQVSTTSGKAVLRVDQCPESASFSSVSGSATLYLPENNGFTAKCSSVSGRLRCEFPVDVSKEGKGKKVVVYKDGGDTDISFKTTSGTMEILKA